MSCPCGCNSNPCNCLPQPSLCCTPTSETVEYTFENANLAGVGVFDNETDYLVQFRGVRSLSASLTVTLNATDNTIDIDFDDAQLVADIPNATTTQRGILETATNAEAVAKAATDKILTPSNLAALGSTTTFAGLVELATNAETITGGSSSLAVTPAGFAAAFALGRTVTWADEVTRNGATPAFLGQIGVQQDVFIPFVSSGTGVGDFNVPLLALGVSNTMPSGGTTLNMNANALTLAGSGTLALSSTDLTVDSADATFRDGEVSFGTNGGTSEVVNFANTVLQIEDVVVPANSVLLTSAVAGTLTSLGITEFLSAENTSVWQLPSGAVARTTFGTYAGQAISNPPTQAEVQAIDDALVEVSQRLGGLITDLMASLKPHVV